MIRVAFVTKELQQFEHAGRWYRAPIGGAGYYRCQLVADALNEHSDLFEAKVFGAAATNRETGEIAPVDVDGRVDLSGYPIVVLQRWMHPETVDMVYQARFAGQIVINDLDDHLFALHETNDAAKRTTPADLECYARVLRASNVVTVTNERLAEVVAGWVRAL